MGFILSAFSWCYCFMQVPSGWIVDRFGVRRAYACGFALWSIACALTGAFRDIAAIMFFRVTMGVGQSVAFPASARTVANWFLDTQRGLVNSSYLIGVRLGQALVNAAGVGLIAALWLASVLRPQWHRATTVDLAVDDRPAALGDSGSERRRAGRPRIAFRLRRASVCFAIQQSWGRSSDSLPSTTSGSCSSIGSPATSDSNVTSHPAQMAFHASVPFVVMSIVIVAVRHRDGSIDCRRLS